MRKKNKSFFFTDIYISTKKRPLMIIFLRKIMTGYTNLDTLRKKVFLIDKSVIDKS